MFLSSIILVILNFLLSQDSRCVLSLIVSIFLIQSVCIWYMFLKLLLWLLFSSFLDFLGHWASWKCIKSFILVVLVRFMWKDWIFMVLIVTIVGRIAIKAFELFVLDNSQFGLQTVNFFFNLDVKWNFQFGSGMPGNSGKYLIWPEVVIKVEMTWNSGCKKWYCF